MLLTENAACAAAYAALAVNSFAHSFIQNAYSEPLFTCKEFFDEGVRPNALAVVVSMAMAAAADADGRPEFGSVTENPLNGTGLKH